MGKEEREVYDPEYRTWAADQIAGGNSVALRLFRRHQRERGVQKPKTKPKNPAKVAFIKTNSDALTEWMRLHKAPYSARFVLQNQLWTSHQQNPDIDPFTCLRTDTSGSSRE